MPVEKEFSNYRPTRRNQFLLRFIRLPKEQRYQVYKRSPLRQVVNASDLPDEINYELVWEDSDENSDYESDDETIPDTGSANNAESGNGTENGGSTETVDYSNDYVHGFLIPSSPMDWPPSPSEDSLSNANGTDDADVTNTDDDGTINPTFFSSSIFVIGE